MKKKLKMQKDKNVQHAYYANKAKCPKNSKYAKQKTCKDTKIQKR